MTRGGATWLGLGAGLAAVLVACNERSTPVTTTTASASASVAPVSATATAPTRPRAAIEKEIALLERDLDGLRKQAPRTFDVQKAKRLNAEMEALEKRLAAAKRELDAAPSPGP